MKLTGIMFSLGILLFVLAETAASQPDRSSAQELFNLGNTHLENGRFTEAIAEYESIVETGFESGPLYLNMGIAATRSDSLGLAKFYYLKARQFEEVNLAAADALNFIDYELGRRGARLPQLAWTRVTQLLLFDMNHVRYIGIGLLMINIGVIFIAVHWLRPYRKQLNRYLGIIFITLGALMMTLSAGIRLYSDGFTRGIQIQREAQIRNNPSSDAEIIQTGYEGFQYIIDVKRSGATNGWFYVRMSNGSRGWVESQNLKPL